MLLFLKAEVARPSFAVMLKLPRNYCRQVLPLTLDKCMIMPLLHALLLGHIVY